MNQTILQMSKLNFLAMPKQTVFAYCKKQQPQKCLCKDKFLQMPKNKRSQKTNFSQVPNKISANVKRQLFDDAKTKFTQRCQNQKSL